MNFSNRSKARDFIKEKQAELRERRGDVAKIDEKAEVEKRGYSEDEKRELETLSQEIVLIQREIDQANHWLDAHMPDDKNPVAKKLSEREVNKGMGMALRYLSGGANLDDVPEQFRCMIEGRELSVDMSVLDKREAINVDTLVPTVIGDIIGPLEKGIIFDKLGIKMQNNMTGNWILPVLGAVEASIADKNAELTDSTIDISKLTPKFVRIGIAIPVNNEDMNDTNGKAWQIVTTQAPLGFSRLINRAVFSETAVDEDVPSVPSIISAPLEGDLTFVNLVKLKGTVLGSGVVNDGSYGYVMNENTKAVLETTPRNPAGGDRMIVENDKILGYPVLTTGEVKDNVVLFGMWSYYLIGNKSGLRIKIDTTTLAKKDQTQIVINGTFAFQDLRKEAFAMLKPAE